MSRLARTQPAVRRKESVARILGIDLGERRIGIAISSPEGGLAVPLRILEPPDEASAVAAIAEIARSEGVEALVVGHPISMDGSIGAQAKRTEAFAKRLAEASGLPLDLWDERLSTAQAQRMQQQNPKKKPPQTANRKSRKRGHNDDLAAAVILQNYLDSRR